MNSSEVNNLVTVLVMFGAPWVAKYGISSQELSMVIGTGIAFAAACWAVFSHWNMKKVPEKATVIPPVASVIAVFILGAFALVAIAPGARAAGATKNSTHAIVLHSVKGAPPLSVIDPITKLEVFRLDNGTLKGPLSVRDSTGKMLLDLPADSYIGATTKPVPAKDPLAVVQAFTVSDLQAALADAQQVGDTVAAACYTVLIPYVQANVKNPLPGQLGAFIAFQKARDLQSTINAGVPSQINVACAPLVLDAANTVIGLGAKVGVSLAMPFKLPLP